ncbi:alpha-hydroxy-acid oxidizing protein [Candidatus Bathyarchaeota archaeon]|nr:alpha-hydroxy-acid oxidizing protein [Candidatus Bathyarchaeota archaeon]
MDYTELVERAIKKLESLGENGRIELFKGIGGGCESGQTSITNRAYFNRIQLKMRLIDSKEADTTLELFGCHLKTPIMSGAMSGMTNLDEKPLQKIARALKEVGSMMWIGICSNTQLQSVVDEEVPVVKISKPYATNEKIIENVTFAEDVGAVAVGVDIDFFYGAKRGDRILRRKMMGTKTLNELKDIISTVNIPFVVKGILSTNDAIKAREAGAKAIVISNHGSGVLDHAAHPLQVLPEVANALDGELDILVDSGFRRGTDVLKGLALGAKGVLLGVNTLFGLAANGMNGVRDMFVTITEELRRTMSITGCANLNEIDEEMLIIH